ncbi:hypothetical protein [Anseongella ginsenosidimutans]|uniref:hypothetical protein n=1 Tax=Anseongella ginsenosidimutans TaxID=496056 RepID=UPI001CEF6F17|nr:hypothetical protein [Anseongella ginsenosidimutans]
MKIKKYILYVLLGGLSSCSYLDIVPDNIATIDNAFVSRNMAEKFLFTCYSYLPGHDNLGTDPAFLGAMNAGTIRHRMCLLILQGGTRM